MQGGQGLWVEAGEEVAHDRDTVMLLWPPGIMLGSHSETMLGSDY